MVNKPRIVYISTCLSAGVTMTSLEPITCRASRGVKSLSPSPVPPVLAGSFIVATLTTPMSDPSPRLTGREVHDLAVRIALSWRALRRDASTGELRDFLYGTEDGAIEQGQMDTLDLLALRPAWRMSELAEDLRVDPSTATRAVQRLVNDGLAVRRACSTDGRVVEVEISEQGKQVHKVVSERRVELMSHILQRYRSEELPVLADVLERFVRASNDFVSSLDSS